MFFQDLICKRAGDRVLVRLGFVFLSQVGTSFLCVVGLYRWAELFSFLPYAWRGAERRRALCLFALYERCVARYRVMSLFLEDLVCKRACGRVFFLLQWRSFLVRVGLVFLNHRIGGTFVLPTIKFRNILVLGEREGRDGTTFCWVLSWFVFCASNAWAWHFQGA